MMIARQLEEIRQRIDSAVALAGREPGSVRLMAVSKTFPVEDVLEAYAAGQRLFGENRVQEAQAKIPGAPADIAWHLIGPLQRNKVRKALQAGFSGIDAVDSFPLVEAISRIAGELGVTPEILLEVHIGGEESKHGFTPEELREGLGAILELPSIRVRGLMTIPPPVETPEAARPYFAQLRELRDALEGIHGVRLPELSMGMSHDFEAAIAEGSTCVRVGTAIFGRR